MRYSHCFQVEAPREEVAAFHRASSSMAAITPPPVVVRMHEAPAELSDNTQMAFTLWLGPLPLRWRAHIDQLSATGFRDTQIVGPFASWIHRHSFTSLGPDRTEVRDEIEATLPPEPARRLLAWGMWMSLPLLFAYRAWKTRRVLNHPTRHSAGSYERQ